MKSRMVKSAYRYLPLRICFPHLLGQVAGSAVCAWSGLARQMLSENLLRSFLYLILLSIKMIYPKRFAFMDKCALKHF